MNIKQYGYYQQHIRPENFTADAKIEAIRENNRITVVVWYAIERGEYLKIFDETEALNNDVWEFAKELVEDTAIRFDVRENIVDLTR